MADLSLRIALDALDRATEPLRRVRQGLRSMDEKAKEAAGRLRRVEGTARDLDAFATLREKADANREAMAQLRTKLDAAREAAGRLEQETGGTGRAFKQARKDVARLESEQKKLSKSTDTAADKQTRLGQSLAEAGVNTGDLTSEQQRLRREMESATEAAQRLHRRAEALGRLRGNFRGLAQDARAVTGRLSSLAGMTGLGGLVGGGMATAGLGNMLKGFADTGREVRQWAARLGMGTDALQAMIAVGGRFGVQQDAMIDGLKELSLRADEFAVTGAGGGAEAFQRLGLSSADLATVKGDTEALFELIRQRMEGVQDVAARQRLADELFGGQGGEQLTEMLSASTAELQGMRDEAQRMGAILSPEEITAARDLNAGLGRLSGILDGLSKTISARLAPVLTPLLTQFSDWIVANKDLIASQVGATVERLSDAVQSVDWSAITDGLTRFRDLVSDAVEFIGGWDNALIAVGVTMGAGLIGDVVSLGSKLFSLAGAALPAVIGGVRALSTALITNPILAVIGAIAFGAYAIYANWDKIGAWFTAKLDKVRAAFDVGLGSGLWEMIKQFNPWRIIWDAWDGLFDWLFGIDLSGLASSLWDDLKSAFSWNPLDTIQSAWAGVIGGIQQLLGGTPEQTQAIWDRVKAVLSWTPLGLIATNWEPIVGFFKGVWDSIPAGASAAWEGIKTALSWTPLGAVASNWEPIVGWFGDMWTRITARFREALAWIRDKIQPAMDAVNWIGDKVGGWFSDGNDEDGGDEDNPLSGSAAGPPPPLFTSTAETVEAARSYAPGGAAPVTDARTFNITVSGAGLNETQLAALIRREIEALDRRMGAGGGELYDGAL